MKRTLQFKRSENGFACFEGEENIFEISASDLQFNVKDFYQAFYSDGMDYEDIVIENGLLEDKNACRIYDCLTKLIEQIKSKMAELELESEAQEDDKGQE